MSRLSPSAAFYQTIIDNNLFRPLGWRSPVRAPQYELIGTLIGVDPKAFILDKHSNEVLTLTLGDNLGESVITDISSKGVKVSGNGENRRLMLTLSFLR